MISLLMVVSVDKFWLLLKPCPHSTATTDLVLDLEQETQETPQENENPPSKRSSNTILEEDKWLETPKVPHYQPLAILFIQKLNQLSGIDSAQDVIYGIIPPPPKA